MNFDSYIAGVMDSDGSFSLCKRVRKNSWFYRPVVQITWKNTPKSKKVFKKICEVYGGRFNLIKNYSSFPNKRDDTYLKYNLEGNALTPFLIKIGPHLMLKKEQATLLLKVKNLRNSWLGKTKGPWDKPKRIWNAEEKIYRRFLKLNTKNGGKGRHEKS